MSRRRLAVSAFILLLLAAILFSLVPLLTKEPAINIISADPAFKVTAARTAGTNHVYYYGDYLDRILDPAVKRLSDTNAYRLLVQSEELSSVIWVRLENPAFSKPPPIVTTASGSVAMPRPHPKFRAFLQDRGTNSPLEQKTSLVHLKGGYYVGGWILEPPLKRDSDAAFRVEDGHGAEIVAFRFR